MVFFETAIALVNLTLRGCHSRVLLSVRVFKDGGSDDNLVVHLPVYAKAHIPLRERGTMCFRSFWMPLKPGGIDGGNHGVLDRVTAASTLPLTTTNNSLTHPLQQT